MLWRTCGSVLGLHGVIIGAAVDLANSGCVVGMVALRTTRRCVAACGGVALRWRGGFTTFAIAVRARYFGRRSLLLRCRFGCGPQRWLRVHGRLRGGINGVGVCDLARDLFWNRVRVLVRGLRRGRLSLGQ